MGQVAAALTVDNDATADQLPRPSSPSAPIRNCGGSADGSQDAAGRLVHKRPAWSSTGAGDQATARPCVELYGTDASVTLVSRPSSPIL
jgi:hypothetical protein